MNILGLAINVIAVGNPFVDITYEVNRNNNKIEMK